MIGWFKTELGRLTWTCELWSYTVVSVRNSVFDYSPSQKLSVVLFLSFRPSFQSYTKVLDCLSGISSDPMRHECDYNKFLHDSFFFASYPSVLSTLMIQQYCIRLLSSSSSVCDVCIVAKRCVLEQKLLSTAYRKSYMRNRLVPKWVILTFV